MTEILKDEPDPEEVIQQWPVCEGDLSGYRGSWVKVREGHVVDSALDPMSFDNGDKLDSDLIFPVPSQANHWFLASTELDEATAELARDLHIEEQLETDAL